MSKTIALESTARLRLLYIAALLLALTLPRPLQVARAAATLTVCASGCTHTTIQAAIAAASPGDTIGVRDTVHTEAGIVVNKNLTIQGQGDTKMTVQGADRNLNPPDRVFTIAAGATVTIENLSIVKGKPRGGGGGGILNYGTLTLLRSAVTHNMASSGANGVNGSTGTTNTDPSAGSAGAPGGDGGGIHNASGASLTLKNSVVQWNRSGQGGLGGWGGRHGMECVPLFGCLHLRQNGGAGGVGGRGGNGGGIFNAAGASLTIIDSSMSYNQTSTGGYGGIGGRGGNGPRQCILCPELRGGNGGAGGNGGQGGQGGGIFNAGSLSIVNSAIDNHYLGHGGRGGDGGIGGHGGDPKGAGGHGGRGGDGGIGGSGSGIFNVGSLSITNSGVVSNNAGNGGPGGDGGSGGMDTDNNRTKSGDGGDGGNGGSAGHGAGLYNQGNLSVVNSTLNQNSTKNGGSGGAGGPVGQGGGGQNGKPGLAGGAGYGSGLLNAATATLTSITLTSNTSSSGTIAGIYTAGGSRTSAANSILAGNVSGAANSPECNTLVSQGYNLIQSAQGCVISGAMVGDIYGRDPLLEPNGSGPKLSRIPLAGSPTIDAIPPTSCGVATDQRGVLRPDGRGCEIGSIELDTVLPDVSLNLPAPDGQNLWYISRPVLGSVTASDSSTIKELHCSLDGVDTPLTDVIGLNTTSASATLPIAVDGIYDVGCTAIDGAGNNGARVHFIYGIRIDATPPRADLTEYPANPSNSSSATFVFTGTDNLTSAPNLRFECSRNALGYTPCTSPQSYTVGEGGHAFAVRAIDQAGNVGVPVVAPWRVDLTPPTITGSVSPAPNANGWYTSDVTVTFTCADNSSGVASCGPNQIISGEGRDLPVVGTAMDKAGNSITTTLKVTIDKTAPQTRITGGPTDPSASASALFSFTGADNVATPAELRFECALDGGSFAPCTSPQRYDDVSAGRHAFVVRAIDPVDKRDLSPDTFVWEAVPDPALLAEWSLDEGSGSTTADISGGGHTGQLLNSPTWAADRPPTRYRNFAALAFDGVDDSVQIDNPAALNFAGQITLAAWVKPQVTDGIRNILAHGYTRSPNAEVFLRVNDGRYEIGSWNGGNHLAAMPIPANDLNQWVHLVGVYDGASWRLYRNGAQVATMADTTGALQVEAGWAIGSRGSNAERFFQGLIDDVLIYNRALSPAEIAALASR
jgi:hypothetical protein